MVSLADIKEYLGETTTTYDDFLTNQELVIAQSIEGYCGRLFSEADYIERFFEIDYRPGEGTLKTFHYPLIEIDTIKEFQDGVEVVDITEDVRSHNPSGQLINTVSGFFQSGNEVEVTYTAGFTIVPAAVSQVLLSIIEEKYNKKKSGAQINFGSDVQRISIPGTISIDFDYSLQSNERKIVFGTLLGNYVNILDYYRSERNLVGSGRLAFLD